MLALSLGLQAAGHRVTLIASPENKAWVEEKGCPFKPFGCDVMSFISRQPKAHSIPCAFRFWAFVRRALIQQLEGLGEMIQEADLVIGASLMFGLSTVADQHKMPYRYVAFCPQLLPSGRHPFPAIKQQGRPLWFNRFSWWLPRVTDAANFHWVINRFRRRHGLKPIGDAWRHILGEKVLVASDPGLAKVPPDVCQETRQTGYLHLPVDDGLDPALQAFVNSGPAPVFVGFGSMPKGDQTANRALVQEAIKIAGVRAVVSGGFGDASSCSNATCFWVAECLHALLFPRMRAVVHHGGAGTTAAAAFAGVPQVIVPHVLDQYYWGHRIFALKLGPKPLWRAHLTAERLAGAIRQCVDGPEFSANAQYLSETIRRQTPLTDAMAFVLR